MREENGMTIIELLVTMAMVLTLTGMSVQNYNLIKARTYDTARDHLIHDARTALEASRTGREGALDEWMWVTSDANGELRGFRWSSDGGGDVDGKELLPGLSVNKNTRITASMDAWCENNAFGWCGPGSMCCITQSILAYHCKGNKVKNTLVWNNGEVWEMEWPAWGC